MSHTRPYDDQMPEIVRNAAVARRKLPDGVCHPVRLTTRGLKQEEHYEYPWDRMKLGDYFLVPLRGRKTEALAVRFRQMAARKDWELSIVRVEHLGEPHLRVCLTVLDVSQYRGQKSDGRWLDQRKQRYQQNKNKPKCPPKLTIVPKHPLEEIRPEKVEAVAMDATLSSEYDREKIVRERLAALGISR